MSRRVAWLTAALILSSCHRHAKTGAEPTARLHRSRERPGERAHAPTRSGAARRGCAPGHRKGARSDRRPRSRRGVGATVEVAAPGQDRNRRRRGDRKQLCGHRSKTLRSNEQGSFTAPSGSSTPKRISRACLRASWANKSSDTTTRTRDASSYARTSWPGWPERLAPSKLRKRGWCSCTSWCTRCKINALVSASPTQRNELRMPTTHSARSSRAMRPSQCWRTRYGNRASRLSAATAGIQQMGDYVDLNALVRGEKLDDAPAILRVTLVAPYLRGLQFVAAAQGRGGWPAVNNAHRRPPATSEQVLHPEKFFARERGEAIEIPDNEEVLAAGFTRIEEDTLGELELSVYLGQGQPSGTDDEAAAGWAGDRLAVYVRGDQAAVVWWTTWDTDADAHEAFAAARAVSPKGSTGSGRAEGACGPHRQRPASQTASAGAERFHLVRPPHQGRAGAPGSSSRSRVLRLSEHRPHARNRT